MIKNILELPQNGDSIESQISQQAATAPYIIQAGPSEARQYFIAAEKEIFLEIDDLLKAIIALLVVYYIFDIIYPKQWNNCLLFIEKKLFGITSGPNFSPLQADIISDIENTT